MKAYKTPLLFICAAVIWYFFVGAPTWRYLEKEFLGAGVGLNKAQTFGGFFLICIGLPPLIAWMVLPLLIPPFYWGVCEAQERGGDNAVLFYVFIKVPSVSLSLSLAVWLFFRCGTFIFAFD